MITQPFPAARRRLIAFLGLCGLGWACTPTPHPVSISLRPLLEGRPWQCSGSYSLHGRPVSIHSLKLYAHGWQLEDADGSLHPLTLDQDERWQHEGTVLLDLEDGSSACRNGSPDLRAEVRGQTTARAPVAVHFQLGLPFSQNHLDPMTAPPLLAETSMHWDWQGGHKFFRLEGKLDQNPLVIHLGSTGCRGTIGHIEGCAAPNIGKISVAMPTSAQTASAPTPGMTLELALHIDRLLAPLAPTEAPAPDRAPPSLGCMSGSGDPGCPVVESLLGIAAPITTATPAGVFEGL